MKFKFDKEFIKVKDFSVSGESFMLLADENEEILKTFPQPHSANLDSYYQTDDYISHTDSKRNTFEFLYHLIKKNALKNKIKLIKKFVKPKNVLDIGCGTGDFLVQAKKNGWITFGFEPNSRAKHFAKNKGVTIIDDIDSIESNSIDVITLWHVLEHIPDFESFLHKIRNLLTTDGIIVIAVPNFKSYDAKFYNEFWAAYDVPRHLWHFSKKAIFKIASSIDMKLHQIIPMYFDSFYVSLLSEKYKNKRMNFFKGFFIGLYSNIYGFFKKEYSSHVYILKK